MKFKEWIKNLKVPRLIIEALLIFGSVYMALLLEADRSRDFEREMLIGELESLSQTLTRDSLYFSNHYYNKLIADTIFQDSNEFEIFFRKGFYNVDLNLIQKTFMHINSNNDDSVLSAIEILNYEFDKSNIDVPNEYKSINEQYLKLIIIDTLKERLNGNETLYEELLSINEEMSSRTTEFHSYLDYNIFHRGARKNQNDLIRILQSHVTYNYLKRNRDDLIRKKLIAELISKNIPVILILLDNEIQVQEEAIQAFI